ncbi:unnamed protein product [Camellia sinensis]
MGDAVLSAFMQVVFQQLASPLVEEFGLLYNMERHLKKLSRLLTRARAVICDAEQRQSTEQAVAIWLTDLKDVAYDADNILDEMSTQVLLSKFQVPGFFSSINPKQVFLQIDLALRIDEVIGKLEDIAQEREDLHLKEGIVSGNYNNKERLQTSSLIDEFSVFGRSDDKEEIVSLLMLDDSRGCKLSIIPIVGIGGLGKTTLAQLVYNDWRVEKHFELRMWVCAPQDFNPRVITKAIIESATGARCDLLDMDPMQRRLQAVIKDKKYFLVLDDVWNENRNDWEVLQVPFSIGANGSKIIVTTRSKIVSSMMGTTPAYHLKDLSNKDCWSLFQKCAFQCTVSDAPQNLVKIGKKIVHKYQGLPLAVKALGSHLNSVTDENEWDIVLKSELSDLPKDKDSILPTLKLSYNHLPSHLKQCFVYCSLFHRDHIYEKESLIQLWMGEGFLQTRGLKQMEEVGRDHFHELQLRSFFYFSHSDPLDGQPKYKMHGLIHDLSRFVNGGEYYATSSGKIGLIPRKARHVSLQCDHPEPVDFEIFNGCKTLRTLLLLGRYRYHIKQIPMDLFLQLKCLRELDLSHTSITELPNTIGELKHLRYLDLSWSHIRRLPESTSNLCNLQTLKLMKCLELHALPEKMSNLENLRHLNISFSTALLKILPFADRRLLDLPKCIKNLINLRDIDTTFSMSLQYILPFVERESHSNSLSRLISTPPGLGKLTKLQTLSNFVVTKRTGCGVEELKGMANLQGSLCISKLENVMCAEKAKEADLKSKHRLQELTLRWSEENILDLRNGVKEEAVIECLHPNKKINVLRIENFGGKKFPSWIENGSLSNLVSICIINCQKCQTLPKLCQLPFLKDVKIHGIHGLKHIGREFYGEGGVGFPSLEILEMKDMPNLAYWAGAEAGEIPCLRELTIWDCPMMIELPNLPCTLTTLEIVNCRGFKSFPMLHSIQNLIFGQCAEVILNSLTCCFTFISSLTVSTFTQLRNLPDGPLQNLTSLRELKFIDCDELAFLTQDQSLGKLSSLEYLEICCCPKVTSLKDENLPNTLKSLRIVSCPSFTSLPDEIQNLSALEILEICNCPQLSKLPEREMPAALQIFWVTRCPALKARCQDEGEDWPKISHIPNIRIDLEWIQQNYWKAAFGTIIARRNMLKSLQVEPRNMFMSALQFRNCTSMLVKKP